MKVNTSILNSNHWSLEQTHIQTTYWWLQ